MAKKKATKKTAKKKATKRTAKKKATTRSPKRVAKKAPRLSGINEEMSDHFSTPFSPPDTSRSDTFPAKRSMYKDYPLERKEARFSRGRIIVLAVLGAVVILLAIWSAFSGEEKVSELTLPVPEQTEETAPIPQDQEAVEEDSEGQTVPPDSETTDPKSPTAGQQETQPSDKATTPGTPATEEAGKTYTVQTGDTLTSIARKTLGNTSRYREIMELNGIKSATQLVVGQKLQIPPK